MKKQVEFSLRKCCICGNKERLFQVSFTNYKDWFSALKISHLININIQHNKSVVRNVLRRIKVCHNHFEDKYFTNERKYKLLRQAIPTLNLPQEERFIPMESYDDYTDHSYAKNLEKTVHNIEENNEDDSGDQAVNNEVVERNPNPNKFKKIKQFSHKISKMCRVCWNVLQISSINITRKIAQLIEQLLHINLEEFEDNLPKYICENCFQSLEGFAKFKNDCVTADQYIKEKINDLYNSLDDENNLNNDCSKEVPLQPNINTSKYSQQSNSTVNKVSLKRKLNVADCNEKRIKNNNNEIIELNSDVEQRKQKLSLQMQIYSCEICAQIFVNKEKLIYHKEEHCIDIDIDNETVCDSDNGTKKTMDVIENKTNFVNNKFNKNKHYIIKEVHQRSPFRFVI